MTRIYVAAGVVEQGGSLFMVRNAPGAKPHKAGKWEFPGGKVRSYEYLLETLVRELKEELGAELFEDDRFKTLLSEETTFPEIPDTTFTVVFLHAPKGFKVQPVLGEGFDRMQWIRITSLEEMVDCSLPADAEFIKRFLKEREL